MYKEEEIEVRKTVKLMYLQIQVRKYIKTCLRNDIFV